MAFRHGSRNEIFPMERDQKTEYAISEPQKSCGCVFNLGRLRRPKASPRFTAPPGLLLGDPLGITLQLICKHIYQKGSGSDLPLFLMTQWN